MTEDGKIPENLPKLEFLPEDEVEKQEVSFIRKLDIPVDPNCVFCKYISAGVCYGSSGLVLTAVTRIPKTNLPGRIMTSLFGIGLFGLGTLRLFIKGKPPDLFFK